MRTYLYASLSFAILSLVGLMPLAGAQAAPAQSVQGALEALQQAETYKRGAQRGRLVQTARAAIDQQGQTAAQPVMDVVQNRATVADRNLAVHCIVALGELKADAATDLLLDVMSRPDLEYAYQSAIALGRIWDGRGTEQQARPVNARLLGFMFSDLPQVVNIAAAQALVNINRLNMETPGALSQEELLARFDQWVAANHQSALPSPSEWPARLLARVARTAEDQGLRQQAVRTLLEKQDLSAIDPMLESLAMEGLSDNLRQSLGNVLSQLSGISFPPNSEGNTNNAAAEVEQWRNRWLDHLEQQSDQRHVNYTWQRLEALLRTYSVDPNEELSQAIQSYRNVLLHQLDSPEGIPEDASAVARNLLVKALEIKSEMADAVATLQNPPDEIEKLDALTRIEELVSEPEGDVIAQQFLPQLIAVARDAEANTALRLGRILYQAADLPLSLDGATVEQRRQQLNDWIVRVQRTGKDLRLQS